MRRSVSILLRVTIACTLLLALGFGIYRALRSFESNKHPIELRKSLENLDENKLQSFKVISKDRIQNNDVLESLGTKDYLTWQLEDTKASKDSPVRLCSLFIAYYPLFTNVRQLWFIDKIYLGGGYFPLSREQIRLYSADNPSVVPKTAPMNVGYVELPYQNGQAEKRFGVLYLYMVNGDYASDRSEAMSLLNKDRDRKQIYLSKVELKFFGESLGHRIYPDKQQAIQASEKLLALLLPILQNEHWPKRVD
jgi:hypothetical protein